MILVNDRDEEIGTMEKMEAHERGFLHRAFSVFIFNSKNEMLLQQRSLQKYHSGGLWTNACCSHPSPNESIVECAQRRLQHEMGFTVPLEKAYDFIYKTTFHNGLIENEYDHVFVGTYDGPVQPNPDEVMNYTFRSFSEIRRAISEDLFAFTTWFRITMPEMEQWWKKRNPRFSFKKLWR